MKNLIIGANGYVGASIYEQLKDKYDVIGTYNSNKLFEDLIQLDITKKEPVKEVINTLNPDVVILVSAIPSGNVCDKNPLIAQEINVDGVKNVLDSLNDGTKVIYISSFAAINPTNLYGETKKDAEELVKNHGNFVIIRPSLIVGKSPNEENDRPFNRILKNIVEGEKATYDDGRNFQPTYLQHINEAIDVVLEKNITNQIIPIATKEQTTRFRIAEDILKHFNIPVFKEEENNKVSIDKIEDLSILSELGIPEHSYEDIISKIIGELKNVKQK